MNKDTCRDYLQQRLQDDVTVRPLRLRKAFKALGRAFLRVHSDSLRTDHVAMRKAAVTSPFPSQINPLFSFLSSNGQRGCIEDSQQNDWQKPVGKVVSRKSLSAKKPLKGRSRSSYAPSRLRKVMRRRADLGRLHDSAKRRTRARSAQRGRASLQKKSR